MCGIAGFIDFKGDLDKGLLRSMVASLRHRGPDDSGVLVHSSSHGVVGLGHARLAILDLTESGHQPMTYGHLSIVFNGEIYNFRELRAELEELGYRFGTRTDTEVVLHAFAEWGIDCLQRFIGMFAFCLHDSHSGRVYFVRDRAGVKPLFVYRGRDFWLFGSELKAFHECSRFVPEIDLDQLIPYFDYGFVPDSGCIFRDCEKVDAGEYWILDLSERRLRKERSWSVHEFYRAPKLDCDYSDAVAELERLLSSACNYRMISDVPVGVFLSGGYDSTAVAAILQSQCTSRISTFTIGFPEGNDEAPFARQTARHLGTEHHEFYCSTAEAQEIIPDLATIFDEPFADSSAIPTVLVSRMARKHVTVALSADGGDEVFCGYKSYRSIHRRMQRLSMIPPRLRPIVRQLGQLAGGAIPNTHAGLSHRVLGFAMALSEHESITGQKLHAFSKQLPSYYRTNILAEKRKTDYFSYEPAYLDSARGLEAAMARDYSTYLKDDILVKVDRATMSAGLEGREPLVDHRLVEFVARLPFEFKFDGVQMKRPLRDIVHKYVPSTMMDRPKVGFSLPIYKWLRGDLASLLDEFCSPAALRETGFLNEPFVSRQVGLFRKGQLHYSPMIWRLLMLQMWCRQWT